MDVFALGVNCQLSPGIKLNGGVNYVAGSGQSKSERADARAVVVGSVFIF